MTNNNQKIASSEIKVCDIVPFTNSDKYNYALYKRMIAYYKLIQEKQSGDSLSTLYDDITKLCLSRKDDFSKLISSDVSELDKCYSSGAYKAALILAGSILEAVLLDWLSEKDGVNYFTYPYKVKEIKNGKEVLVKKEELIEYIKAIDDIEPPKWMLSDKATKIRKRRNLVHAKLCLKEDVDINKETCEEVVAYLKEIIAARISSMEPTVIIGATK